MIYGDELAEVELSFLRKHRSYENFDTILTDMFDANRNFEEKVECFILVGDYLYRSDSERGVIVVHKQQLLPDNREDDKYLCVIRPAGMSLQKLREMVERLKHYFCELSHAIIETSGISIIAGERSEILLFAIW